MNLQGVNKYENAYRLSTEDGVKAFLNDYTKLAEARFYASDLSISDLLIDFDIAMKRALSDRQRQIITLIYKKDMNQTEVANAVGITQVTVHEHIKKSIKNLASYHLIEKSVEQGE